MAEAPDELQELRAVCPGAVEMSEAGVRYISLPRLNVPGVGELDGLLRPQQAASDGYVTRLYLSAPVPGKGQNWGTQHILGRTWHTWSWNNVPSSYRLSQILANHLRALR
ncbi:MAG TPA: hypothetical protein VL332_04735 [Candidatus Saccharimonadaceae bacterium]|jgi:hypothetical protein|nr:hypothetical protein [Candidatus Saccharimonadaceae bacterium]